MIDLDKYFAENGSSFNGNGEILSDRYKNNEYDKQFQKKNLPIPSTKMTYQDKERQLGSKSREYTRGKLFQSDPINIGQQVINAGTSQYDEGIPGTMYLEDDYMNKINDYRAEKQSGLDQFRNLYGQFIGKTATNVIGGTVGFIYGLGSALVNGDASKIIDNDLLNKLDEWDKSMTENMPVYVKSNASWYNPSKLGQSMVDTYAFIAGAVVTEMLTAGAGSAAVGTKGASLIGKLANTTSKIDDVLKAGAKVSSKLSLNKNASAARQILTSSFWESTVEANRVLKDVSRESFDNFVKQHGRPPTEAEHQEMVDNSVAAGFGTFALNMGILNVSRAKQFPAIFGSKFQASKFMSKITGDVADREVSGLINMVNRDGKNVAEKVIKKGFSKYADNTWKVLKNPLTEGVWEEGGQGIVSNIASNYYTLGYDKEAIDNYGNLSKSMTSALAQQFATKEGWEEMIVGAIVGSTGAPGRGLMPGKYGRKADTKDAEGNVIKGEKYDKWSGGIYGEFRDESRKNKAADSWIQKVNESGSGLRSNIQESVQAGVRADKINDNMAAAARIEDEATFKTKQDDHLFNYAYSRMKTGNEDSIHDEIAQIEKMNVEEFKKEFDAQGTLFSEDTTDKEVEQYKAKTVSQAKDKLTEIKKAIKMVNDQMPSNTSIDYNPEYEAQKEILAHTYSQSKFIDKRINEMSAEADRLGSNFSGASIKALNSRMEKAGYTYQDLNDAAQAVEVQERILEKLKDNKSLKRKNPEKYDALIAKREEATKESGDVWNKILSNIAEKAQLKDLAKRGVVNTESNDLMSRVVELDSIMKEFSKINANLKADLSQSVDAKRIYELSTDMVRMETQRRNFVDTFNRLMTVEGRSELQNQINSAKSDLIDKYAKAIEDEQKFKSKYTPGSRLKVKTKINGVDTEIDGVVLLDPNTNEFVFQYDIDGETEAISMDELWLGIASKNIEIVSSVSAKAVNKADKTIGNIEHQDTEQIIPDRITLTGDRVSSSITPEKYDAIKTELTNLGIEVLEINKKQKANNELILSLKENIDSLETGEPLKVAPASNPFGVDSNNPDEANVVPTSNKIEGTIDDLKSQLAKAEDLKKKLYEELSAINTKKKGLYSDEDVWLKRIVGKNIYYHKIVGGKVMPEYTTISPFASNLESENTLATNDTLEVSGAIVSYVAKNSKNEGSYLLGFEHPDFFKALTETSDEASKNNSPYRYVLTEIGAEKKSKDKYSGNEIHIDANSRIGEKVATELGNSQSSIENTETNGSDGVIEYLGKMYAVQVLTKRQSKALDNKKSGLEDGTYFTPIDSKGKVDWKKSVNADSELGKKISNAAVSNTEQGDVRVIDGVSYKLTPITNNSFVVTENKFNPQTKATEVLHHKITLNSNGEYMIQYEGSPNLYPISGALKPSIDNDNGGYRVNKGKYGWSLRIEKSTLSKSGRKQYVYFNINNARLFKLDQNGITGFSFKIKASTLFKQITEEDSEPITNDKEFASDEDGVKLDEAEDYPDRPENKYFEDLNTSLLVSGGLHIKFKDGADVYENGVHSVNEGHLQKEWFEFTRDEEAFNDVQSKYSNIRFKAITKGDNELSSDVFGDEEGETSVDGVTEKDIRIVMFGTDKDGNDVPIKHKGKLLVTSLHLPDFKTVYEQYLTRIEAIKNEQTKTALKEKLEKAIEAYKLSWVNLRAKMIEQSEAGNNVELDIVNFSSGHILYEQRRLSIDNDGDKVSIRERHDVRGRIVSEDASPAEIDAIELEIKEGKSGNKKIGIINTRIQTRSTIDGEPRSSRVRLLTRNTNQQEATNVLGLIYTAFESREINKDPIFRSATSNQFGLIDVLIKVGANKSNRSTQLTYVLKDDGTLESISFGADSKGNPLYVIANQEELIKNIKELESWIVEHKIAHVNKLILESAAPEITINSFELKDGKLDRVKSVVHDSYKQYLFNKENPVLSTDVIKSEDGGSNRLAQVNVALSTTNKEVGGDHDAKLRDLIDVYNEITDAIKSKDVESKEDSKESAPTQEYQSSNEVNTEHNGDVREDAPNDHPNDNPNENPEEFSPEEDFGNPPTGPSEKQMREASFMPKISFSSISTSNESNLPANESNDDVEVKNVEQNHNESVISKNKPSKRPKPSLRIKTFDNKSIEDVQEFAAWMKSVLPDVPIHVVKGLIKNKAWGMTFKNAIHLSDEAAPGTGFHEAYHIVEFGILTKAQRDKLYSEVRKTLNNNELSDTECSEILAEDFREYKMFGGKTQFNNKAKDSWFKTLLDFIKSVSNFFKSDDKKIKSVVEIYNAIDNGSFKYSKVNTENEQAFRDLVPDFQSMKSNTVRYFDFKNNFVKRILDEFYSNKKAEINELQNTTKLKEIINSIVENRNDDYNQNFTSQLNAIIESEDDLREMTNDLIDEVASILKLKTKSTPIDDANNSEDVDEESETEAFRIEKSISAVDTMYPEMKLLCTSVDDISAKTPDSFGEQPSLPRASMFNKIVNITNGSTSYAEAKGRLIDATENDESLNLFLDRLDALEEVQGVYAINKVAQSLTLNKIKLEALSMKGKDAVVVDLFDNRNFGHVLEQMSVGYANSELFLKHKGGQLSSYISDFKSEFNKDGKYPARTNGRFAELLGIDDVFPDNRKYILDMTFHASDKNSDVLGKGDLVNQLELSIRDEFDKNKDKSEKQIKVPTNLRFLKLNTKGHKKGLSDFMKNAIDKDALMLEASVLLPNGNMQHQLVKQNHLSKVMNCFQYAYKMSKEIKDRKAAIEAIEEYWNVNAPHLIKIRNEKSSMWMNEVWRLIESNQIKDEVAFSGAVSGVQSDMNSDFNEVADKMSSTDGLLMRMIFTLKHQGNKSLNRKFLTLPADSGMVRTFSLGIGQNRPSTILRNIKKYLLYDVKNTSSLNKNFDTSLIGELILDSKINSANKDLLKKQLKESTPLTPEAEIVLEKIIEEWVNNQENDLINLMYSKGLITKNNKGELIPHRLPANFVDESGGLQQLVSNYILQTMESSFEQGFLLFGNLNEYSDKFKRAKLAATDGATPIWDKRNIDFFANGSMVMDNGTKVDNSADTRFKSIVDSSNPNEALERADLYLLTSQDYKNELSKSNPDIYNELNKRVGSRSVRDAHIAIIDEPTIQSLYVSQLESIMTKAEQLEEKLTGKKVDIVERVAAKLKPFRKQDIGDGSAYCTLETFRQLMTSNGEWNPIKEIIFNKIVVQKKSITKDELSLLLGYEVGSHAIQGGGFHSVKPLGTGSVTNMYENVDGSYKNTNLENGWVMNYGKLAVFPLVTVEIEGLSWDNSVAGHLDRMMKRSAVNFTLLPSGSKTDFIKNRPNMVNPFATGINEDDSIQNGDEPGRLLNCFGNRWYDWKVILKTTSDLHDSVNDGSQQRGHIFSDTFNHGVPLDYMANKLAEGVSKDEIPNLWNKLSNEEKSTNSDIHKLKNEYDGLYDTLEDLERASILKDLGIVDESTMDVSDWGKFHKTIKSQIDASIVPDNALNGLKLNEDETGLEYPIDSLVLNEKIQNIMCAMVSNRTIKLNRNGSMSVQASNFQYQDAAGLAALKQRLGNQDANPISTEEINAYAEMSKSLTSITSEDKIECQVYLPASFAESLGLTLEQANEMLKDSANDNMFTYYAYRIPTSGQNMLLKLKVKQFLPNEAGDTVVLPHDIVTTTGADYDIDKLNIFKPNLRTSYKSKDGKSFNNLEQATAYFLKKSKATKEQLNIFSDLFDKINDDSNDGIRGEREFLSLKQIMSLPAEIADLYENYLDFIESLDKSASYVEYHEGSRNKSAVQNRLLEIQLEMLDSEFLKFNLLTPNSTSRLSKIAQDVATLKKLGSYKGSARKYKTLEPVFELEMYEKFRGGKMGTAISSIHAKAHVIFQLGNIGFMNVTPDGNKVMINTKVPMAQDGSYTLANVWDSDGLRISETNNQTLSGNVDAAKDPFLETINYNPITSNIAHMLVNLGATPEWTYKLLKQPIIERYVAEKKINSSVAAKSFENVMSEAKFVENLLKEFGIGETFDSKKMFESMINAHTDAIFTIKEFDANIVNPNPKDQLKYLIAYIAYNNYSKQYTKLVNALKIDTTKPKNLDEAQIKYDEFNELMEAVDGEDSTQELFPGFRAIAQNTYLGAFQKNGVEFTLDLFEKHFLTRNEFFKRNLIQPILDGFKGSNYKVDLLTLDKLRREIYTFIFQKALERSGRKNNSELNVPSDKIAELILGTESRTNKLLTQLKRDKDKAYVKNNLFLSKFMLSSHNKDFNTFRMGLKSGKLAVPESNMMTQSFEKLKVEAPDIWNTIVELSAYQSGFSNTYDTMTKQLPVVEIANIIKEELAHIESKDENAFRDYFGLNQSNVDFDSFLDNYMKKSIKNSKVVKTIYLSKANTPSLLSTTHEMYYTNDQGRLEAKNIPIMILVTNNMRSNGMLKVDGKTSKGSKVSVLYKNSGKSYEFNGSEGTIFYMTPSKSFLNGISEYQSSVFSSIPKDSAMSSKEFEPLMTQRDINEIKQDLMRRNVIESVEEEIVNTSEESKSTESTKKQFSDLTTTEQGKLMNFCDISDMKKMEKLFNTWSEKIQKNNLNCAQ